MTVYRLGTRKSLLALTQSRLVQAKLREAGLLCELVEVESPGDVDRKTPLYEIEPESPGLFTKTLEQALLRREVDLAVHSLKDLPTEQPPELQVTAVTRRADTDDCLLVHRDRFAADEPLGLPSRAKVGTSSLRREAQLLAVRPDLVIVPIRGNVPTRVAKAQSGEMDGVVLAAAGLERLALVPDGVARVALDPDAFVPAPGQGALALETRRDVPGDLALALSRLHDIEADVETRVERRILRGLHGGCTLPLGVRCRYRDGRLAVRAFLGLSREGSRSAERNREWTGFYHFTQEGRDEGRLIDATVEYFRSLMAQAGAEPRKERHGRKEDE